jgi:hypothetical protein
MKHAVGVGRGEMIFIISFTAIFFRNLVNVRVITPKILDATVSSVPLERWPQMAYKHAKFHEIGNI